MTNVKLGDVGLNPIPASIGLSRRSYSQWPEMLREACADTDPANLYMRLYYQMLGLGNSELALEMQAAALQHRTTFLIEGALRPRTRLLVLMGPGGMTDNTPIDFLLDGSDISLTLLFVLPDKPLPEVIPDHDVAFVALSASQKNDSVLRAIHEIIQDWPRPVLNRPEFMTNCLRDTMSRLLMGIGGLLVPVVTRFSRYEVALSIFPCIIRPVDTQGGVGLAKINSEVQLKTYLQDHHEVAFYVSEFIPFQSSDGLYRKYRIALIEGIPYACHMAISDHWMVHYFSANMHSNEAKRSEEKNFMENFDTCFGLKHASALAEIYKRLKLDYLVLDCAETADGNLLVFEVDSVSWIHDTDPIEIYPYKPPVMRKAFDAFISMVHRTSQLRVS